MSEVEEFLLHYGTKGMKWGVRKQPLTPEQRSERRIRNVKIAGATLAGIAVASYSVGRMSQYMQANPDKYQKGASFVARKAVISANAPVKAVGVVNRGAGAVKNILAALI